MTHIEFMEKVMLEIAGSAAKHAIDVSVVRNSYSDEVQIRFNYNRSCVVSMPATASTDAESFKKRLIEVERGLDCMCDFLARDGK